MERNVRDEHDAGQAVPLMLGVVALAVVVLLTLVPLARAAADRARASAAADAAALAGAADGEEAARDLAAANGAELVQLWSAGTDVWVEVRVGRAVARARARREGPAGVTPGRVTWPSEALSYTRNDAS